MRRKRTRGGDRLLLCAMAIIGALIAAQVALVRPLTATVDATATQQQPGGVDGQVREVDSEQIRRLIIEGRLSDREAEYYRELQPEDARPVPTAP